MVRRVIPIITYTFFFYSTTRVEPGRYFINKRDESSSSSSCYVIAAPVSVWFFLFFFSFLGRRAGIFSHVFPLSFLHTHTHKFAKVFTTLGGNTRVGK